MCNTDNSEGIEHRFTQHDKKNGLTCLLQYINLLATHICLFSFLNESDMCQNGEKI